MKSKFTLWSVVLLLAGFIFVGCDNERTQPVCHRGRTGGHAHMSRRLRAGDVAGKERGKRKS